MPLFDTHFLDSSYLKDIDRIARPDYIPSDDDVVRARLRTVGVQEHRVVLETGESRLKKVDICALNS